MGIEREREGEVIYAKVRERKEWWEKRSREIEIEIGIEIEKNLN